VHERAAVVLIVAVVATVLIASANWWSRWRDDDRLELVTKPAATIGAIVVAIAAASSTDGPSSIGAWIVVALVLCLVGDVMLLPAVDRFVLGLASFLAGHLVLVGAFVRFPSTNWTLAGLALVACALMVALYGPPILRGAQAKGLLRPVQGYLAVISVMCVAGWSTGNWLVCLGSASFVVSDAILGWRRFVVERRWASVAIMVTYHLAIVAIAASPALL
jgi:uncharacterized membrane protein YhhN